MIGPMNGLNFGAEGQRESERRRFVAKNLDDLKVALFSAKDGGVACDAINKLTKHAKKGNDQAKMVLAAYVCDGSINHMREFACSGLAGAVSGSYSNKKVIPLEHGNG